MTQQEFDNTSFTANMHVKYKEKTMQIASVDFEEKLIGILALDTDSDEEDYELTWVRCENCKIIQS